MELGDSLLGEFVGGSSGRAPLQGGGGGDAEEPWGLLQDRGVRRVEGHEQGKHVACGGRTFYYYVKIPSTSVSTASISFNDDILIYNNVRSMCL
jgi:hypothetical protein